MQNAYFKCARDGKRFETLRALVIHSEVKQEDGVIATLISKGLVAPTDCATVETEGGENATGHA